MSPTAVIKSPSVTAQPAPTFPLSPTPSSIGATTTGAASVPTVPENCKYARPEAGVTVILCQPNDGFWDKAAPSFPALGMSFLALCVSAYAVYYNSTKDSRVRQQSIQDDFWLRKVVSPVSIEPFVKFSSELLATLPDAGTSQALLDEFAKAKLAEFRGLIVAFRALELFSKNLYDTVEVSLEKIEDRLADYLADVDSYLKGTTPQPPSRPEVIAELSALRLAVLEPIKQHQAALGLKK